MRTLLHSAILVTGMADKPQSRKLLEHVGVNLRRLRKEANLSQEALAQASGISRRMIVNVEAGDTNISLTSLDRLAEALDTNFVQLVRDPEQESNRVKALVWQGQHPESHGTFLGSVPAQKDAQLLEMVLDAGDRYQGEPDPEGWHEIIYVLSGEVQIELELGTRNVVAGDFTIYSSAQPFAYCNKKAQPVRFLRFVVS